MTFRARQGSNRPRNWEDRDRRSFLMNIGFGITVILAVLLLALAYGASWYGNHLAAAGSVDGQTITKDTYNKQLAVNAFRVDYATRRVRTLLTAGHLAATDAQNRLSGYTQLTQQAPAIALEQLIDGAILDRLAAKQNVTVTDADVDAKVTKEATTPETRHVWVIAVSPKLAAGETTASLLQTAVARQTAVQALADVKAGKDWATIAKSVSSDPSAAQGGDLGFIDSNTSLDQAFIDAVMAAPKDTPTDVVEGSDGTFRIGKATEIVPAVVDATFQQQLSDAGINVSDFRTAMRFEVLRTKLDDAITAQLLAPGPQRKVAEIWQQEGQSMSGPSAIRVRHILYSPNGDPAGASKVAASDPAWAAAKAKADATYAQLKANPDLFDSIARAQSDESSARTTGGKLPYYSTADGIDPAFALAIFKGGYQPGQLLAPIKSTFGWHVIQVMHYPTDMEWANTLKTKLDAGVSFATLARDNSDQANATDGGDMGWVARGQLSKAIEDAIFAAPIGKVSNPLQVTGDGVYLFLVSQEQVRPLDAKQAATVKSSAFSSWYAAQKAQFKITRDPGITGGA
jgi:parvulin-like peptidyl-prolyl isomerase